MSVFLVFSSSFCLYLVFIPPLFIHPAVPITTPPAPLFRSLPGLTGLRPCGLEDDVRQYEQDLAKRLYQARVRASQGTSEAPTSSASSAASQLRSASRPRQLGPDAMHHGGVLGCFGIEYFFAKRIRKVQTSTCSSVVTVLPPPLLSCFCTPLLFSASSTPPLPSLPCLPLSAVLSCTLISYSSFY